MKSSTTCMMALPRSFKRNIALHASGHFSLCCKNVFLFTILACLISLPSTTAAPVAAVEEALTDEDYQLVDEEEAAIPTAELESLVRPIWVNPCGVEDLQLDEQDGPLPAIPEIVAVPLLEVNHALRHGRQLTNEFVQKAFRTNLPEVIRTWSHIRYDWLPGDNFNHKKIGDKLTEDLLNNLQFDSALRDTYTALQKVAIGLEQVILDQAVYGGDYLTEFKETELKLRLVLCSLQSIMTDTGILKSSDAARHVMSREYRDLEDTSARNLRDFIILREYTNVLEYAQQVLEHFKNSN